MIPPFFLFGSLQILLALQCSAKIHRCVNDTQISNRIFVLTDVGNEPDDSMSLVRLLVHSDLYDVQGLVVVTSFWLPNSTMPQIIHDLVDAYGPVRDNLQSHSSSVFPSAKDLSSKISSGPSDGCRGCQRRALVGTDVGRRKHAGCNTLVRKPHKVHGRPGRFHFEDTRVFHLRPGRYGPLDSTEFPSHAIHRFETWGQSVSRSSVDRDELYLS